MQGLRYSPGRTLTITSFSLDLWEILRAFFEMFIASKTPTMQVGLDARIRWSVLDERFGEMNIMFSSVLKILTLMVENIHLQTKQHFFLLNTS